MVLKEDISVFSHLVK